MSSTIPLEGETTPNVGSDSSQEWPGHTAQLRAALQRDQGDLQRDVVLWQRWVRYAALFVLALVTVVFGPRETLPLVPLAVVAIAYALCVALTAWLMGRTRGRVLRAWLPSMLLTADVLTLAALFYLSSPPAQLHRILLLGVLPVQLSVFHFGWRQGAWAALLVIGCYVGASLVAPPFVTGDRPGAYTVVFNAAIFLVVAGVLVQTFGDFRSRMNRLRLFCSKLGEGELTTRLPVGQERHPDDLSLLARSFAAMRDQLAEQIGSDPLTGCLNRRTLERELLTAWRLARRQGTRLAILAIDMDRFKEINDTRGHLVGDLVLQQLAAIMKGTARDTDHVARPGGDEFVVLLPDNGAEGAAAFAERLRRRVDDFVFGRVDDPIALTISVGVAVGNPADGGTPAELVQQADAALYQAKTAGRNRVVA